MPQRGEIEFLDRQYRVSAGGVVDENRPFVFLLNDAVANACGHQLALKGTTQALVGHGHLFAPAFRSDWTRYDGMPRPKRDRQKWYPQTLTPLRVSPAFSPNGIIRNCSSFDTRLRDRLEALFLDDNKCGEMLGDVADIPREKNAISATRRLQQGDLITYNEYELLVLSNSSFHALHPHSYVFVAPILSDSTSLTEAVSFLRLPDSRRLALELPQGIEVFDDDRMHIVKQSVLSPAQQALVSRSLLSFLLGGTFDGITPTDTKRYLECSRDARNGEPIQVAPVSPPTPRHALGAHTVKHRRKLGPTSHFGAPSDDSHLSGADIFTVAEGYLFAVHIERFEQHVTAMLDPLYDNPACIPEEAWFETENSDCYQAGRAPFGRIQLQLPDATAGAPLRVLIGASCLRGVEEFSLDLEWD